MPSVFQNPLFVAPTGDVSQTFNPSSWFNGSSFFNNNAAIKNYTVNFVIGKSMDTDIENKILWDVGSYGRQLGRLSEVVSILASKLDKEKLDKDELRALNALEYQMDEIERVKKWAGLTKYGRKE